MKHLGRWIAGSLGALALVVVGVVRFVDHPDVVALVGGLSAAVVIVGVVLLVMWLPAGLALRAARLKADGPVYLAVGDHSIPAAVGVWRSPDLGEVLRFYAYFVLEVTDGWIGVWEGGTQAVRVASIPAPGVRSVTREYGPFRTTSPIAYLSVQLAGEVDEIRFAVTSLGPLKTMSAARTATFAEQLATHFGVPLLVSETMQAM